MKLFTYVYEGKEQIGALSKDNTLIPLAEKDMQTLIKNWSEKKQKEMHSGGMWKKDREEKRAEVRDSKRKKKKKK